MGVSRVASAAVGAVFLSLAACSGDGSGSSEGGTAGGTYTATTLATMTAAEFRREGETVFASLFNQGRTPAQTLRVSPLAIAAYQSALCAGRDAPVPTQSIFKSHVPAFDSIFFEALVTCAATEVRLSVERARVMRIMEDNQRQRLGRFQPRQTSAFCNGFTALEPITAAALSSAVTKFGGADDEIGVLVELGIKLIAANCDQLMSQLDFR